MIPATSKATTGNQTGQRVGMSINDIDNKAPAGYNPFDLSYSNYCTPKAGEITPIFVQNAVGNTMQAVHDSHNVRAYTFNAPLMSQMRMHKAYYSVPMACIMRHTWPYFFANPNKGDDVPDDVVCNFNLSELGSMMSDLYDAVKGISTVDNLEKAYKVFTALMMPSLFCSYNSLFNYLKQPINDLMYFYKSDGTRLDCDDFMSELLSVIAVESESGAFDFAIKNDDSTELNTTKKKIDGSISSIRDVFFSMLYDSSWQLDSTTEAEAVSAAEAWRVFIQDWSFGYVADLTDHDMNVERILAYQLSCAQFFTTSTVDFVYDARLWQSNAEGIFLSIFPSFQGLPMFDYNGFKIQYDPYSCHWNRRVMSAAENCFSGPLEGWIPFFAYWSNLLCFNRSLRYVDYFTGGRVQPLAVGDVNAPVTGSNVSAVDITIAIQKERMLAAANRTGPELREYLKGIFGYEPISMPAEPHFIASQTFTVQSGQVANTAELPADTGTEFGRIVENVNFSNSNYAYMAYIDEESILVGVCYFDYIPAYIHAVDKHAWHNDRFDRFQPYLQTIGEQKVELRELNAVLSTDAFAYQIRNMEYKQRFSNACGGFVKNLPSWSLNGDIEDYNLNPNSIRQMNVNFDKLYSKLSGMDLSSYFHFIVSNTFDVTSNEPMLRKPQIL